MVFQPGKSGNPGGRPKRDMLTQHIIAELNELDDGDVTKGRKLVMALIGKAIEGDVSACREILDRVEGKVATVIAGDEDNPLRFDCIEYIIVRPGDRATLGDQTASEDRGGGHLLPAP